MACAAFVAVLPAGSASAQSVPAVLSVRATPSVISGEGGPVTVEGRVQNATSCQLTVLSSFVTVPLVYPQNTEPCSGLYLGHLTVGTSNAPVAQDLIFGLIVSNANMSVTGRFSIDVGPRGSLPDEPKPIVQSVGVSPTNLGPKGGTVTVTAAVKNAKTCQLKLVAPRLGFAVVYNHGVSSCKGIFNGHISFGANTTPLQRTVPFELVSENGVGDISIGDFDVTLALQPSASATPQGIAVASPAVTAPGSDVNMKAFYTQTTLTSQPDTDDASGLTTTSTALADFGCIYNNGRRDACPMLPGISGYMTWAVEPMGQWQQAEPLPGCTSAVSSDFPASSCDVWWGTYGDHEVQATFHTTTVPTGLNQFTGQGTTTAYLPAPLDLAAAARGTFNIYGNDHLNDCVMASAADYIEMATGTVPDPTEIVNDFNAIGARFMGAAGSALSGPALDSYWKSPGIAGTTLMGSDPWTTWTPGEVEQYLTAEHKPLMTSNLLPLSWGQTSTGGRGAHEWDIAGFSTYGPMVVTWGTEFQISWAQFENVTTSVTDLTI
jgi:hypothetical protein